MSKDIRISVPGRICLFGDHQDYLGLPVIACAIDRSLNLFAKENNKDHILISMPDIQDESKIFLSKDLNKLGPNDLLLSAINVLRRKGLNINKGYHVKINSNIPINAGISSSSALITAWIQFLLNAFGNGIDLTHETIAKLAYEAEVTELNAPGGNMDQITIAMGGIVFIETDKEFSCSPIKGDLGVMILANSGIPKDTTILLTNIRKQTQESFDRIGEIHSDFDPSLIGIEDIKKYEMVLPEKLKRFFRAAIENHIITQQAKIEFERHQTDPKILGVLMSEHHQVLKEKLGITVPKIDTLIETAINSGAFGAKIVGSGGGGCIVALTDQRQKDSLIKKLLENGATTAYEVRVAQGINMDLNA
jgi:galactokinase